MAVVRQTYNSVAITGCRLCQGAVVPRLTWASATERCVRLTSLVLAVLAVLAAVCGVRGVRGVRDVLLCQEEGLEEQGEGGDTDTPPPPPADDADDKEL